MFNFAQKPLILASASESRQALLRALGLQFDVVPSTCDEEAIKQTVKHFPPVELAQHLAACKALSVSQHYPDHLIIGGDQVCVMDNIYFSKPGSHERAVEQLSLLQGKTHQQISACCVAYQNHIAWQEADIAYLTMRPLSIETINNYLLHEQPYQSCGAYHYEGLAKWLFSNVVGHDSTIQGLPIHLLINALLELEWVGI